MESASRTFLPSPLPNNAQIGVITPELEPRPPTKNQERVAEMLEVARQMAAHSFCPRHLVWAKDYEKTVANCFRIVVQARRWNLDPFAVADQSHVIEGRLEYSGTLMAAALSASGLIDGRLSFTRAGAGQDLTITVRGVLRGEREPKLKALRAGDVITKSLMWRSDPENKLFYSTVRAWAKLHCPELLVGFSEDSEVLTLPESPAGAIAIDGEVHSIHEGIVDPTLKLHTAPPPFFAGGPQKCSKFQTHEIARLVVDLGLGQIQHNAELARRYNCGDAGQLTADQANDLIILYRIQLGAKEKTSPTGTTGVVVPSVATSSAVHAGGEAQTLQEALEGQATVAREATKPTPASGLATQGQLASLIATRESYFAMVGLGDAVKQKAERAATWQKILAKWGTASATTLPAQSVAELEARLEARIQQLTTEHQAKAQAARQQAQPPANVPPASGKS